MITAGGHISSLFGKSPNAAMNDVENAIARGLAARRDMEPEQGPCSCPVAMEGLGPFSPDGLHHTAGQHVQESCGGPMRPDACGGCWDCMCAQFEYADEQQRQRERLALKQAVEAFDPSRSMKDLVWMIQQSDAAEHLSPSAWCVYLGIDPNSSVSGLK